MVGELDICWKDGRPVDFAALSPRAQTTLSQGAKVSFFWFPVSQVVRLMPFSRNFVKRMDFSHVCMARFLFICLRWFLMHTYYRFNEIVARKFWSGWLLRKAPLERTCGKPKCGPWSTRHRWRTWGFCFRNPEERSAFLDACLLLQFGE